MSLNFSAWSPLPNLRGEFGLETLLDDEEGFHVTLRNDTGRKLRVDFRSVMAYRLTGRVLGPSSWMQDPALSGESGALFQVEPSAWKEELRASAPPEAEVEWDLLTHFALVLPGEVIEILSDEEPNVAWLNSLFGDAV